MKSRFYIITGIGIFLLAVLVVGLLNARSEVDIKEVISTQTGQSNKQARIERKNAEQTGEEMEQLTKETVPLAKETKQQEEEKETEQNLDTNTEAGNNNLPKEIFRYWIYSREESKGDLEVYRPEHYSLPDSWTMSAFEIKKNGKFVDYRPGPSELSIKYVGHWEAQGEDNIIVYFEKGKIASYTINIISYSSDILRVKINNYIQR